MKEQTLRPSPVKHSPLNVTDHDNKKKEVLWIADMFQITPAGREQLQKVAQQRVL